MPFSQISLGRDLCILLRQSFFFQEIKLKLIFVSVCFVGPNPPHEVFYKRSQNDVVRVTVCTVGAFHLYQALPTS